MRKFWTLYSKEMLESLRSYRLVWIPVVFIILGIMQPLTTYYLPDILKASGDMPPGMLEGYEMPGAAAVMAQALGQYGTIGMLVLALAAMNSLAGERSSGSAELLMVKPIAPAVIILAKWAAHLTVLFIALGLGAAAAGYYTVQLMGSLSVSDCLAATGLYSLWLLSAVSLTLLFSAFMRGPAAAFLALLSAAVMSLLYSLLPSDFDWLPAALPDLSAGQLTEGSVAWLGPVLSAVLLILACIAGAAMLMGRNKLPD
ncbi:ABC transporter permease [Paenibacillus pedocola]|uniref:ABC transporter permease n=1 Tax=Paenibacillus pedocola TaxID=3242193 RepID=UPI00287812B4|nr:ABC transporter permease subunit [Paenibacillus typhae]